MDKEVKNVKIAMRNGVQAVYKKSFFIQTENFFINNRKYNIYEKMVFMCLHTYAGKDVSCYPSKKTISNNLAICIGKVNTTLQDLEKKGAIIIINRVAETNRKTSNIYMLCDINKYTGDFMPETIEKFKELSIGNIKTKGK